MKKAKGSDDTAKTVPKWKVTLSKQKVNNQRF